jgi:hypothetical protein
LKLKQITKIYVHLIKTPTYKVKEIKPAFSVNHQRLGYNMTKMLYEYNPNHVPNRECAQNTRRANSQNLIFFSIK